MNQSVKAALFRLSHHAGANRLARWAFRHRIIALCYHSVVETVREHFTYRNAVGKDEFEEQLILLNRLFRPVSCAEVIAAVYGAAPLPPKAVLVTFDDGFRNNCAHAAPLLKRHGVPAVFHLTTGYIGKDALLWTQEIVEIVLNWRRATIPMPGGLGDASVPQAGSPRLGVAEKIRKLLKTMPNEEKDRYMDLLRGYETSRGCQVDPYLYRFMDWDEARALQRDGFEIGAHTVSHPILTRLGPQTLKDELEESKAKVETELGAKCEVLAYPNGMKEDYSPEVAAAARKAGYRLAFNLAGKINPPQPDPFEISRIAVAGLSSSRYGFHTRVSGLYSLLRA